MITDVIVVGKGGGDIHPAEVVAVVKTGNVGEIETVAAVVVTTVEIGIDNREGIEDDFVTRYFFSTVYFNDLNLNYIINKISI